MEEHFQHKVDEKSRQARTALSLISLPLGIGACVVLLASDCSKPHLQETVTVAPRSAATQTPTASADASFTAPAAGDETEAAGDALAHAIVALKSRRRDEALRYINLARGRLTHLLNRTDVNLNSNSSRERLIGDLHALDNAERAARRNDYAQSRTQLLLLSNELDHLTAGLDLRQN